MTRRLSRLWWRSFDKWCRYWIDPFIDRQEPQ